MYVTQAETVRAYGEPLAADYPRYTSGTAMLETAERFTPVEKEPALRQFLLLVGGLRALGEGAHDPRLVLDAFLLRSLAVAGYAPALDGVRGVRRRPTWPAGGCRTARDGAGCGRRPVGHARVRDRGGRPDLPVLPAAGGRDPVRAHGRPDERAAARATGRTRTRPSGGTR